MERVRPELPAGADGAGSEPVADTAGERQPPVSDPGQHGEERGPDPGAERQHLQGRLALLRPQLQLLHPLQQPPLPLHQRQARHAFAALILSIFIIY